MFISNLAHNMITWLTPCYRMPSRLASLLALL